MTSKKVALILLLVIALLPMHSTHAQSSYFEKLMGKDTPSWISQPIFISIDAIEKFRVDFGAVCEFKLEETKDVISALNDIKVSSRPVSEVGKFFKYFKYAELFFFYILSFLFNNAIAFYFSFLVILFLIFRIIWHAIFKPRR